MLVDEQLIDTTEPAVLGVKLRHVLDAHRNPPDGVLPLLRDELETGLDRT
jgi:hypothetical protein